MPRVVTPLASWFPSDAALARFRRRALGVAPVVLAPRDRAWRSIVPRFAECVAMAAAGLPFQIAADRRYDRSGDPAKLRRALGAGATVYLPQIHQALPRLARLIVALRAAVCGPGRDECSFLFLVEGRRRPGMGLHHDGAVDAFWLQLEGRRTVTIGPRVRPGTPEDLRGGVPRHGRVGWRTLELPPGTLFHLPPFTPHEVVCHGRSLAVTLTWRRRAGPALRPGTRAHAAGLAEWDVASGRVAAMPQRSARSLWTQVPAAAGPLDRARRRFSLRLAGGATLVLPARLRALAARLELMPRLDGVRALDGLAPLVARGLLGPEDLPLRILPDRPRALDGWRFA